MPELPEVENIVRGLREPLVGRRIEDARIRCRSLYRRGSLRVGWLAGRVIVCVERVGKNAVIRLSPEGVWVINLGMTGRLEIGPAGGRPPRAHLHSRTRLEGGDEIRYYDTRRFGHFYVAKTCDFARELNVGPDPYLISPETFRRILERRRAPIKTLLLDQRLISGIGNIYSDESLFFAGIDPRTPGSIVARRTRRLLSRIRTVLDRATAHGGSTLRDYRRPDGSLGRFQEFHAVYGRRGLPCTRCGRSIQKITLAGRGTHFCPTCQR